MNNISPQELKTRLDRGEELQLIDIREIHEREICCLESEHIPMDQIMGNLNRIRRDVDVIIHCKGGDRASAVVHMLEKKHGFTNVYNLSGGIMAWASLVDPQMATY